MLTSFRIAELQTLLSACGRSRSGRKHELLGRAMSLLKSSEGSPMRDRVKTKILELYHQRCAPGISPSSYVGSSSLVLPQKSHNDSYNSYVSYENDRESAYLNRPTYIKSQRYLLLLILHFRMLGCGLAMSNAIAKSRRQ